MKKTLILITGFGLGAVLTYLFEPGKGNLRRRPVRNKVARGARDEGNVSEGSLSGDNRYPQVFEDETAFILGGTRPAKSEVDGGSFPHPNLSYRLHGSFLGTCVWGLQKAKSVYERTSGWPLIRELYGGVAGGGRLLFDVICRVSFGVCLCTAGLGILARRSPSHALAYPSKGLKDNKFTKKEVTLLAGFVSLALLSRLSLLRCQKVMTPDGVYYATLGENLVSGNFREGLSTFYPPLYPLLTGLSSLIFRDAEAGGRMVSAMAGGLLVVPVYLLMRSLYGTGAAPVAAFLIAIHPALNYHSTLLLTESTYTLLFTTALLLGLNGLSARGIAFFSTGLLLGACYLIRPEAIGYLVLMSVSAFGAGLSGKRFPLRRALLKALGLVMGFALLASPYVLFLRQRTGRWTISDKLHALRNSDESLERKWFGLAPGRRTTLADRLYAGIYQADDQAVEAGSNISSARDFREAIGHSLRGLKWEISYLIHHLIPPQLMALAGLGLFKAEWSKELYLLLFFFATLIGYAMLPDAIEGRLLLPLLPLSLCWVARGIEEVGNRLDGLLERINFSQAVALKAGGALKAAGMAALLLSLLPWVAHTFIRGQLNQVVEHKQAGAWIREHSPAAVLVMATNPYAAFYAGRKPLYLPAEEYPTVIDHATRQKVDFLVIDEGVISRGHWGNNEYSNLQFLLDEQSHHPELELVYKFDGLPNRKILIYTLVRDFQTFKDESLS